MPIPANPQLPMTNANSLRTTLVNQTANTLSVVVSTPDSTQILSLSCATLGAQGSGQNSVTVLTQYNDDNTLNVGVWDPSYSENNSVASFYSHQKDQDSVMGRGSLPWIDTVNFIGGYAVTGQNVSLGQITVAISKT
ncbi:hypothetical protein KRR26_15505 [Corallococcus sp. M34]|uniref:hypothetical protein n=1 Tax=Citreicoccus inhibens TaxID=2849499 RepID=UPI001C22F16A|nr:hypothetical protein [Citreicoccus inhibens]MBU8897024.1 hypothetical protein [Citreicoccus inhibens]